ncbi:hypothetical protein NLI96_g471 [Meripilus lineatus]|uniref:Nucleoporin nup45 n=1 Tax=Meripilus lineatus TaxID=2056292 RepID=A0AAD5VER8_9APHY|nr:hypothetical protein NLI96_g471 [Physisporinus lineatus]
MSFGGASSFFQGSAAATAKPTGSIFGTPAAGGSALGSFGTQNQTQPAQSSLFGTQATQSQQQQQPQQQQTSSLFPALGQQPQQSTSSGFLSQSALGQPQQSGQQSVLGSSIFGGSAGTQQQQPVQQQSNLFGGFGGLGSSTAPALNTQGQQSTGFGSLATSTAPSLGAFGAANQSTNTNPLFGNRQLSQQPTQPSFGGFGAGNAAAGSLFNKQPSQQQFGTMSTAQSPVVPPLTKSTKFNDLPDQVKKVFEDIDAHIQGRIQISKDLKQRKVGDEATKGQDLIRGVHKDLLNTISVLQTDVRQTKDIKSKVDQSVQDTIVATHIVDGFRNPQQSGTYLKDHANFPLEFYNRVTEEMRERLEWCKNVIEAIERKLSSAVTHTHYTPQTITSTLGAQHSSFVALANKTAALDAELQKIKTLYTQLWRAKTGSMRDPFNELDRGSGKEFGMESLSGK